MNLDQTLRAFLYTQPPGRRLRILLAWAETSGVKVSAKLSIQKEFISRFMHGETHRLRGDRIKKICAHLDVPEEIFKEVLE